MSELKFITKNVPIMKIGNVDEAKMNILTERKPIVLQGLDIGECTTKWSPEYLINTVINKEVKLHVCASPQMDFIQKNFQYKTLQFDELIRRCSQPLPLKSYFLSESEKYYLRTLGTDPRKIPADFTRDFPELGCDIKFPALYDVDSYFSSVFRVASPGTQLWTHYDIMDNILIQIRGKKSVVLYHPDDAEYLYLHKDKSKVLDINNPDKEKYPLFYKACRYECELDAGDVLFIPALWFHNVTSLEFGIAVNVFWRHLPEEFYEPKDPYGNKDLIPANRAFEKLSRALKDMNDLPYDYKRGRFKCERELVGLEGIVNSCEMDEEKRKVDASKGTWADPVDSLVDIQGKSESIPIVQSEINTNILIDLDTQVSEPIKIHNPVSNSISFTPTKTPPSTPQNCDSGILNNPLNADELICRSAKIFHDQSTSENSTTNNDANNINSAEKKNFPLSQNYTHAKMGLCDEDKLKVAPLSERKLPKTLEERKQIKAKEVKSNAVKVELSAKNSFTKVESTLSSKANIATVAKTNNPSSPKRNIQKVIPTISKSSLSSPKRSVTASANAAIKKSPDGVTKSDKQIEQQSFRGKEKNIPKFSCRGSSPRHSATSESSGISCQKGNKSQFENIKSRCGSLENASHIPQGGGKRIENRKLDWKRESKVGSLDNAKHKPSGGDKKILNEKLEWKVSSRIGSLDNAQHRPGGGNVKVKNVKLEFREKAQSKIGSKDNMTYTPGGGDKKIETRKLGFKETAKARTDSGISAST
ncbi:DgyrCDS11095 [Dimorphilus gyrociliatus]|uniref:DgyrCDS11095 n=1 Tax=Dimorphilus gyrociliatus TaxID=2664684 RepID=A0A7I8W290_9ANNE|nr:DgyrCDS11095 [Dimorphilus gyrociliatus]